MKHAIIILGMLSIASSAFAEDAAPSASKVIAIGDVETGYDTGGQKGYELKETIQLGLKKEIEKLGKGRLTATIVSPAVVTAGSQPEPADLPDLPTDRAPTQKEMATYMAAMQQYQKQMMGQIKTHKPVAADAYFDIRVASGQSGVDTGGIAGEIGSLTGLNTSIGDISTKSTKVYLIATMRDPKTGALIDKHTTKASSVKVRNIAGYSDYDYGSDELTRERLFASAIKDCAKWMTEKVQ